jgi:hypothetical protein
VRSLDAIVGHCSRSSPTVIPSGPGAPLFATTFNIAESSRSTTSSILARVLLSLGDDRLRHPRSACPGPVPDHLASGPHRVFCCRDRQPELRRRLLDRDRLPLPTIGLDGHYPAVRYHAVLRLLLGHQPSLPPAYRTSEPNRSPRVSR